MLKTIEDYVRYRGRTKHPPRGAGVDKRMCPSFKIVRIHVRHAQSVMILALLHALPFSGDHSK